MVRLRRSFALLLPALIAATLTACRREETPASATASSEPAAGSPAATSPAPASAELVNGGRYLVTIMGCNDCHTPYKMGMTGPEPDMSRMLSGHPENLKMPPPPRVQEPWGMVGAVTNTAWAGPWGISYSTNLTPDQNTGIGIWTEDMFIRAMRTGKHLGTSRTILPPMPWPWYAKMRDEELKAVFAFLKSIPPIRNRVPDPAPPAGGAAP